MGRESATGLQTGKEAKPVGGMEVNNADRGFMGRPLSAIEQHVAEVAAQAKLTLAHIDELLESLKPTIATVKRLAEKLDKLFPEQ